MCQSHTGRLTGLWFLPKPAFGLNTNDDDDDDIYIYAYYLTLIFVSIVEYAIKNIIDLFLVNPEVTLILTGVVMYKICIK